MTTDLIRADDLRNIDLEARIQIAKKVGKLLSKAGNSSDQKAAMELARLLVEDVSISVREALSRELQACSFLPKDMVSNLSRDIDQISMPFLMASEAMDDAFLETIVRDCGVAQQEAVARRDGVSEIVSYAICDVGGLEAVDALLENDTADMSERAANRVVDRFPVEVSLMEKLSDRTDLPVAVAERIIFKISARYGEYLSQRFGLAADYSSYLTSLATRQVFARTLEVASQNELMNYLRQLKSVGGLNSDVILGYLQNKNVRLFIAAMAALSGKPFDTVENLIGRPNKPALSRMFNQAGFSPNVIGVLLIAYERLFRG